MTIEEEKARRQRRIDELHRVKTLLEIAAAILGDHRGIPDFDSLENDVLDVKDKADRLYNKWWEDR